MLKTQCNQIQPTFSFSVSSTRLKGILYSWFAAMAIILLAGCSDSSTARSDSSTPQCNEAIQRTHFDVACAFGTKTAHYVDPFIGTKAPGSSVPDNAGNTFPGAVAPWGMVSVSPHNKVSSLQDSLEATQSGTPLYTAGYAYGGHEDEYPAINGFGYTHLSGTGCPDLGAPVIMATVGNVTPDINSRKSTYNNELAHAGYYSVELLDFGVRAEATATTRVGINRFTFPLESNNSNVLIDAANSLSWLNPEGYVSIISDSEVEGWTQTGQFCFEGNRQKIYFVARFNRPSMEKGTWQSSDIGTSLQSSGDVGAFFRFDTTTQASVEVAVGISYVSVANARENLDQELAGQGFDYARSATVAEWDQNLSRLLVSSDPKNAEIEEQKTTFYTALYHSLLHPSVFSDVNGEYIAMGSQQSDSPAVVTANGYTHYNVFSLWDTYRTVHPLLTLVYPERQLDMLLSIAEKTEQSGRPPKWEIAASEVDVMVGDPALIVVADSYLKGLTDFDVVPLYQRMKAAALDTSDPLHRPGNVSYQALGYVPMEEASGCDIFPNPCAVWGPVSTTLEYGYADWSLAQLASALGFAADATIFSGYADGYTHLFDSATDLIRPKNYNGSWDSPFDANADTGSSPWPHGGGPGYVEGSAWNYAFFVPHDILGLASLHGGDANFVRNLSEFFSNNHFAIWNEPDLAYPYLFTYFAGEAWRTQELVRDIMADSFSTSTTGIPGNDDTGAISAWYVFSAMGFYPDNPVSGRYSMGSPLFDHIEISLQPKFYPTAIADTFTINVQRNSTDELYFQEMKVNSVQTTDLGLSHDTIVNGGSLNVTMSASH
jgi:predicted alpha-1,2-mannosidase